MSTEHVQPGHPWDEYIQPGGLKGTMHLQWVCCAILWT